MIVRFAVDAPAIALDVEGAPAHEDPQEMRKVLIVDDEASIRKLLATLVGTLGDVSVEVAANGAEGLELARRNPPDLIISDVNMPDMDGLAMCEAIRKDPQLADTHVLLLTARGDQQDKYEGLAMGADDYIVKPFDPIELQLRIKLHLRRAAKTPDPAKPSLLAVGAIALDMKRSTLTVEAHELKLTAAEFSIMRHLAEHPDELVTVADLLQQALQYPPQAANPAIIHTHMRNIRAKLREAGLEGSFMSSSRQGYMLSGS